MHTLYTGQLISVAENRVEGAEDLIAVIQQAQAKLADLVADHYRNCAESPFLQVGDAERSARFG